MPSLTLAQVAFRAADIGYLFNYHSVGIHPMSIIRTLNCFMVLLIVSALPNASFVAAGEGKAEVAKAPVFDTGGKIMVLLVDRSNALEQRHDSEVIENAKFQTIGGRLFIVGTAYENPNDEHDWRKGAEVGVAWEEVTSFYLYSSEQFQNYANSIDSE